MKVWRVSLPELFSSAFDYTIYSGVDYGSVVVTFDDENEDKAKIKIYLAGKEMDDIEKVEFDLYNNTVKFKLKGEDAKVVHITSLELKNYDVGDKKMRGGILEIQLERKKDLSTIVRVI